MQKLTVRQEMKQRLTPQQLQFMNLLQLSQGGLEHRIRKEVEVNPALAQEEEVANELTLEKPDKSKEDRPAFIAEKKGDATLYEDDVAVYVTSWREELEEQLRLLPLDQKQKQMATYIISILSDGGYLLTPLDRVAGELALLEDVLVNPQEVEKVLKELQGLEPPGVGARNLKESLRLQLNRKKSTPSIERARKIIESYFDLFTKRQYGLIQERMSCSAEEFAAAREEIQHLKPQPVLSSQQEVGMRRLAPDFFVWKRGKTFQVDIPKSSRAGLRIHDEYERLLQAYKKARDKAHKQAMIFIERNIQRAKWFIQAIEQRHKTLLKIVGALVALQRPFFETEEEANLRPITLRHIAERVRLDVSTVSRAMSQKALQTEQNIYPMKFFFSEAIPTLAGDVVSSRAIKKMIADLITQEDKSKPYTDEKLVKMLTARNLKLARRTVAKYREQLGLPSSRLRKIS